MVSLREDLHLQERARAGLFLGFQYPVEIPGVNNAYLLKAALNAMTEGFAQALGPRVRVNTLMSGTMFTDVAKSWDMDAFNVSIERIALMYAGHDLNHISQIEAILGKSASASS